MLFLAGYLFSTLSQTRNALDNRNALQAFIFVIFGIYFVWFWAKGQTLAMKTWNIRVVGSDGKAISQLRALGRYALSWLWFLPPLIALSPFQLSGGESVVIIIGWVVAIAMERTLALPALARFASLPPYTWTAGRGFGGAAGAGAVVATFDMEISAGASRNPGPPRRRRHGFQTPP